MPVQSRAASDSSAPKPLARTRPISSSREGDRDLDQTASCTARVTAPSGSVTELPLGHEGERDRGVRQRQASSGSPMNSTVRAAASARTRPMGSARPMSSLARMTSRRARNRGLSPPFEHRDQPVEGAVGVRSPHRLDERTDLVVVRVA